VPPPAGLAVSRTLCPTMSVFSNSTSLIFNLSILWYLQSVSFLVFQLIFFLLPSAYLCVLLQTAVFTIVFNCFFPQLFTLRFCYVKLSVLLYLFCTYMSKNATKFFFMCIFPWLICDHIVTLKIHLLVWLLKQMLKGLLNCSSISLHHVNHSLLPHTAPCYGNSDCTLCH